MLMLILAARQHLLVTSPSLSVTMKFRKWPNSLYQLMYSVADAALVFNEEIRRKRQILLGYSGTGFSGPENPVTEYPNNISLVLRISPLQKICIAD